MEETKQHTVQQEEEISLKDLILKVQEWWRYLLSKWVVIAVFALVGAGLGFTYALLKKPNYVAELTFVLEENKSNPLAAYAGLAGQFGIDLGGSGGSGVFAGDNIMEFLKSRLMVEKALLSPTLVNGKQTSLAELYIDIYELREKWSRYKYLQNIHFQANADRRNFSTAQDSILKDLYYRIVQKNLSISKPDKRLAFILVGTTSPDQIFSKTFTERLVKEATDFYVETKIKRAKSNVDILQRKADSLEVLLNRKTYSAAAARDLNLNPARQVATVSTEMASRDKMMLQTVFGEVIKNLELSRMAMAQETPVIEIIDSPILPLKKEKLGKVKGMIVGCFVGVFLIALILIITRIYRNIMA